MSGTFKICDLCILKMLGSSVDFRIAGPTFRAAHQQCWTGDALPKFLTLRLWKAEGCANARVVVVLPAIRAVFVLVDAVDCQMTSLTRCKVRVRLLHTLEGLFDRRVAPRHAAGYAARKIDPFGDPLFRLLVFAFFHLVRRPTEPFDGNEFAYGFWI